MLVVGGFYPGKQVEYPNVKNAHVVPKMYLRSFSADGAIAVHVVGQQEERLMNVESAGTRRRYYRRQRPDGTPIDDVEWSLSKGESNAAPILQALDTSWPLQTEDKASLGEFFGLQLIRGPRWRVWWEGETRKWLNEQREAGLDREKMTKLEESFLSDTYRLIHMLQVARKMATVFGSMHWTLVEFGSPVLATSDHPVVLWPLGVSGRTPAPTPPGIGVLQTLEIRIPLTPTSLLLLTWNDGRNADEPRVRGSKHHAANANAFTVEEADGQWFHLPDTSPPIGTGRLVPLCAELVAGYDAARAEASARRMGASNILQPLIGSNEFPADFDIVTIT